MRFNQLRVVFTETTNYQWRPLRVHEYTFVSFLGDRHDFSKTNPLSSKKCKTIHFSGPNNISNFSFFRIFKDVFFSMFREFPFLETGMILAKQIHCPQKNAKLLTSVDPTILVTFHFLGSSNSDLFQVTRD